MCFPIRLISISLLRNELEAETAGVEAAQAAWKRARGLPKPRSRLPTADGRAEGRTLPETRAKVRKGTAGRVAELGTFNVDIKSFRRPGT